MWEDSLNGRTFSPLQSTPAPKIAVSVENLLILMAKNEVQLELLRQRLVRDCSDFNTVDAFRLLDKEAQCEVSAQELAHILMNEIQVNPGSCDVRAVAILVQDVFKYS